MLNFAKSRLFTCCASLFATKSRYRYQPTPISTEGRLPPDECVLDIQYTESNNIVIIVKPSALYRIDSKLFRQLETLNREYIERPPKGKIFAFGEQQDILDGKIKLSHAYEYTVDDQNNCITVTGNREALEWALLSLYVGKYWHQSPQEFFDNAPSPRAAV